MLRVRSMAPENCETGGPQRPLCNGSLSQHLNSPCMQRTGTHENYHMNCAHAWKNHEFTQQPPSLTHTHTSKTSSGRTFLCSLCETPPNTCTTYTNGMNYRHTLIVQELCESRGGRPGLSVLTSLLVSVDVKIY